MQHATRYSCHYETQMHASHSEQFHVVHKSIPALVPPLLLQTNTKQQAV